MPGVINSDSQCGFSREVGKMAFFMHPDLIMNDDETTDLEDFANRVLMTPVSSSQSSSTSASGDNAESDNELLPDHEQTVDLIKFLDSQDMDVGLNLPRIKCDEDSCNDCTEAPNNKYSKYRVSARQDPFMGMGLNQRPGSSSSSSSGSGSMLSQIICPLDCDYEHWTQQQLQEQKRFSAWGHTPKTDDEPDLMLSKSSISNLGFLEDEAEEVSFPDTPSPSSRSGTVTGDDSDVDIETITDAPRSADSCGYVTQDSSPAISPSASPGPLRNLQNGSLLTILSKSSASSVHHSACSSSSTKHSGLTSYGVSSSVSLAENLMAGRTSLLGQKRKMSKERKTLPRQQSQPAYTHVLCNSNSVNFHDYAMSPGACAYPSPASSTSTETGRPTVLSKRIYRRKQLALDASDKEKQHHHNQLERNRRQKLADLFIDLRDEVPKIANQPKASKVVILNESTLYIRELQRHEKAQEDEISKELQRKEMLKRQLRQLEAQMSSGSVK